MRKKIAIALLALVMLGGLTEVVICIHFADKAPLWFLGTFAVIGAGMYGLAFSSLVEMRNHETK